MHKRKYFTCSILNWIRRKNSSKKILEAAGLTQAELPPISFSHLLRSNDMRDELIAEVVQRMLPYLDNKQLVNLQNNLIKFFKDMMWNLLMVATQKMITKN